MSEPMPFPGGLPRRVGVIGAGAMGVSLAAVLGQRAEVVLVVRDGRRAAHLERVGAVLRGLADQRSRPRVVRRIRDLGVHGLLDAIFVATKTTSIDEVSRELKPLLGTLSDLAGGPFVISFQNGIETGRALAERLEHDKIIRMVLHYGARLTAEGGVEVVQSMPPHDIGSPHAVCFGACEALAKMLSAGGMETRAVADIEPCVWKKGITNAAMNPVAALVNGTVGEVLDSPAMAIVRQLIDEGVMVAQGEGIDLGEDICARILWVLETARPHVPSMVEDIRAGRSSEVGQLNRQIIKHARAIGVATPTHEFITALIDTFDWKVFRSQGEPASVLESKG